MLSDYRKLASAPANGNELTSIVKKILKNKNFSLGGKNFKRVPKGFDPDYPYSDFLLHDGLYFWFESKNFKLLSDGKADKTVFEVFKKMVPLHDWLVKKFG